METYATMKSETVQHPLAASHDSALRIVIADKSAHMRETVRRVLANHPNCTVVGEAATHLEAVRITRAKDPHIALLDIDLALNETAPRLRTIAESFPRLHVIVMLNEDSDDYRAAVAERWGYSCIAKDKAEVDLARLLIATRRALA